ncbi:MAG: hypothetical protein U1C49_03060 [Candidatus Andersenbacteria bacterium]|nr:hypothetical protein [bacterium]MDZ4225807.1 hypothetical protein [Candidatus Andersenbacteria bacterium]
MGTTGVNTADNTVDQLVFESGSVGDVAVHNLLMGGPGGIPLYQGTLPLTLYLKQLASLYAGQEEFNTGLVPCGMNVRATYQRYGMTVFLVEVAPSTRTLKWIRDDSPAPYGNEATYCDACISLPYQYFFVTIDNMTIDNSPRLTSHNSVYFANQPITSLDEPLGECHFHNCSVNAYSLHCWICTQWLSGDMGLGKNPAPMQLVAAFIEWFYASGFNRSSDFHEGTSFWSRNRQELGDKRLENIAAWKRASSRNPGFVLRVKWRPSLTAREVLEELTRIPDRRPSGLLDLVNIYRAATSRRGG